MKNKPKTKIKTKNKTQELNVKAISRNPRPCYDCEHGSSKSIRNQASGEIVSLKISSQTRKLISRNEARLVAQGYNQQEGIDFDETYAPIARLKSIRILLAYACAHDFNLFQMDVKSAFLNDFKNREVYVAQPRDFVDFEKPNHVFKLKKALYGLKQAPKAWYDRLKAFLLDHKYTMGLKLELELERRELLEAITGRNLVNYGRPSEERNDDGGGVACFGGKRQWWPAVVPGGGWRLVVVGDRIDPGKDLSFHNLGLAGKTRWKSPPEKFSGGRRRGGGRIPVERGRGRR
ncbi:copia protein [Tanacetum coccineum]